jgi:hypothetical protein
MCFVWVKPLRHSESIGGRFDFAIQNVGDHLSAMHPIAVLQVEAEHAACGRRTQLHVLRRHGSAK